MDTDQGWEKTEISAKDTYKGGQRTYQGIRGQISDDTDQGWQRTQIREGREDRLVLQTQIRDGRGRHRLRMVEDIYQQ